MFQMKGRNRLKLIIRANLLFANDLLALIQQRSEVHDELRCSFIISLGIQTYIDIDQKKCNS